MSIALGGGAIGIVAPGVPSWPVLAGTGGKDGVDTQIILRCRREPTTIASTAEDRMT